MRGVLLVLLGLDFAFCPIESAEANPSLQLRYRIVKGDTLGGILDRFEIRPLWGPRGQVEETRKINGMEESADQRLSPGRIIALPVTRLPRPLVGYEIKEGLIESRDAPGSGLPQPDLVEAKPGPESKSGPSPAPQAPQEISPPWKWTGDGMIGTNSFSIQSRDIIGGGTSRIHGDWAPAVGLSIAGKSETLWSIAARLDFQKYAIADVASNKRILNQNGSRLGYEFALGKGIAEQVSFSVLVGSSQQVFNQALSSSLFQIDKIRVYHWGLELDLRVTIDKDWRFSARPRYLFLGSASGPGYELRSGSIWGSALRGYWKSFFLEGGLLKHRQDTSIITNEDIQYTLGFGYEISLFK